MQVVVEKKKVYCFRHPCSEGANIIYWIFPHLNVVSENYLDLTKWSKAQRFCILSVDVTFYLQDKFKKRI